MLVLYAAKSSSAKDGLPSGLQDILSGSFGCHITAQQTLLCNNQSSHDSRTARQRLPWLEEPAASSLLCQQPSIGPGASPAPACAMSCWANWALSGKGSNDVMQGSLHQCFSPVLILSCFQRAGTGMMPCRCQLPPCFIEPVVQYSL